MIIRRFYNIIQWRKFHILPSCSFYFSSSAFSSNVINFHLLFLSHRFRFQLLRGEEKKEKSLGAPLDSPMGTTGAVFICGIGEVSREDDDVIGYPCRWWSSSSSCWYSAIAMFFSTTVSSSSSIIKRSPPSKGLVLPSSSSVPSSPVFVIN